VPAADLARHTGVRHRAQLPPRDGSHPLDRLEDGLRTHRAVESNDVRSPPVERARDVLRRGAERRQKISSDGDLRDDRDRRIELARGGNRLLNLVEIGECLEDEDVHAAGTQAGHLLGERCARLVGTRRAVRLQPHAQWAYRTGDERDAVRRLARELGGAPIQIADLELEPILRELDAVRAKAVCLDRLGTCLHVCLVDGAYEIRGPGVQLVVALIDEDALAVQHRPHRAVEEDDAVRVEESLDGRRHQTTSPALAGVADGRGI
jgi:hypothetical protein